MMRSLWFRRLHRWMFARSTKSLRTRRETPRTRLHLEPLEDRTCPTATTISSFSAAVLAGHVAQLTGHVSDSNPAAVLLTFSGAASGTTHPDTSGNFSWSTTSAIWSPTATRICETALRPICSFIC